MSSQSAFSALFLALALAFAAPNTLLAQARIPDGEIELFDYTVQEGDTCAGISRRFFGNGRRYDLIHAYNPNMGPPPHDLTAGQILRLPRTAPPASAVADATVTGVERRVEARPRPADEDQAARRGLGLYRGGRVATQSRAAAEVTFRDTSVVQLREETLVIIFGNTSTTTRRAGMEATLETGALRTRLGELRGGDPTTANTLTVTTTSGTANLAGGSTVVSIDDGGTSRVSNHSSRASLQGRAGGRAVALPENTGSMVRRGERPTPPRPLPAAPAWAPGATRFLGVMGRGGSISGAWAAVPNASRYHVEISRNADGRDIAFATEVPASITRFEAHRLPAGHYYITVSTLDGDQFESRPSTTLDVEIVEARLLAPGTDPASPAPAFDPGDPSVEETGQVPALEGSLLQLPEGVSCAGESNHAVVLHASAMPLTCTGAAGNMQVANFVMAPVESRIGESGNETINVPRGGEATYFVRPESSVALPSDLTLQGTEGLSISEIVPESGGYRVTLHADANAPSEGQLQWVSASTPTLVMGAMPVTFGAAVEAPVETPVVEAPAPVLEVPHMTDLYAHLPFTGVLPLTDFERRGQQIALSYAEVAPINGSTRSRIALGGQVSLFDDNLHVGASVPYDIVGQYNGSYDRGSLDLYAHVRWVALRRDPAASNSIGLAIDMGAWFPLHAPDASGLSVVRLAPSFEFNYAFQRIGAFRTRQGAILDADSVGTRYWSSAYGLDFNLISQLSIGVELDVALGDENGRSIFGLGVSPQIGLNFRPVYIGIGLRAGINRDGQSLYGPLGLGLNVSAAF